MHQFLLTVHVLVAIGVVALVLLQHGRGADAGAAFGSGSSGSLFGARGPTTFLTRLTTILVAVFFLTSLSLAWLSKQSIEGRSVLDRVQPEVTEQMDEAPGDDAGGEVPELPSAPEQGSPSTE